MGLGKTLQIIALILATKNLESISEISADSSDEKNDSASEFQEYSKQDKLRSCFVRKSKENFIRLLEFLIFYYFTCQGFSEKHLSFVQHRFWDSGKMK